MPSSHEPFRERASGGLLNAAQNRHPAFSTFPNYAESARYILDQIERAGLDSPRVIVRLTEHLAALTKMAAIAEIRAAEGSWGEPYEEAMLSGE